MKAAQLEILDDGLARPLVHHGAALDRLQEQFVRGAVVAVVAATAVALLVVLLAVLGNRVLVLIMDVIAL